jgi:predicted nucleic acid-binding protein
LTAFIDTSALYPMLVRTDARHTDVVRAFERIAKRGQTLWTTSCVLLEATALLQHRVGLSAVRDLWDAIVPVCSVEWVSAALHRRGLDRLYREDRRKLSLVDCVSFEVMRDKGIEAVLAVDPHFEQLGFRLLVPMKQCCWPR